VTESQPQLFDAAPTEDESLDLRADDSAWASCRCCRVLSTAAGIDRHEHGPGSTTCAMYVARYGLVAC
jgi:hypothetical protein